MSPGQAAASPGADFDKYEAKYEAERHDAESACQGLLQAAWNNGHYVLGVRPIPYVPERFARTSLLEPAARECEGLHARNSFPRCPTAAPPKISRRYICVAVEGASISQTWMSFLSGQFLVR